jgi:GNAT superfamily N-acetyltransferase
MVNVRPAVASDGDAIGRVQVETWRAAYEGLLPDETIAAFDVEARQRQWREGLAREPRPGSATFVAELDRGVVGFASVGASRDEGADGEGELYAIYLQPACWDRGIGRALLERAEESMRAFGFEHAILWVLDGNERGESFYRAGGWNPDGRKQDHFGGAEVVELRYRKVL